MDTEKEDSPEWSLNKHDYSGYTRDDMYIEKPKWKDLREEAINSGHCTVSQFKQMVFKADNYMNSKRVKAMRAKRLHGYAEHYGIAEDSPITIDHIQSVLLYTNFTKLCSQFAGTFRAEQFGESLQSIKKRNSAYFKYVST